MSNAMTGLDVQTINELTQRLERLTKSGMAAGTPGLQNSGRTGVSALAEDNVDAVLRSITVEESDFLLTRDMPTEKCKQTVYHYRVKPSVGAGFDVAGVEAFLPQMGAAQYMRVAETLKVYGVRSSITDLAQRVNAAGGYAVDLEKENDTNASMQVAYSVERDMYTGGDYYMSSADGSIDFNAAANPAGPIRKIRGIQANIREGNKSARGIPGDFIGYGNNRVTTHDARGAVLNRALLDKIVTSVRDNSNASGLSEAHCTSSMLAEFRATFFPFERGDLGAEYMIRGAGVTNDEHVGLPIQTVGGQVMFKPTKFKYGIQKPIYWVGSVGTPASAPASVTSASTGSAAGSGFSVGDSYLYSAQAVNIAGTSAPVTATLLTIAGGDADKNVAVSIAASTNAEYFMVFRTPIEASGAAGKQMYIGSLLPNSDGTGSFLDNNRLIPGLDSTLFLPRDKNRAKMLLIGNMLNKVALGIQGGAYETAYYSYLGCMVDRPRAFAICDNLFQQREGL